MTRKLLLMMILLIIGLSITQHQLALATDNLSLGRVNETDQITAQDLLNFSDDIPPMLMEELLQNLNGHYSLLGLNDKTFLVGSSRIEGDWALIAIALTNKDTQSETAKYLHTQIEGGFMFIAQKSIGETWVGALEETNLFNELVQIAPQTFLSQEAKYSLQGIVVNPENLNYKFPWAAGTSWLYSQGWHSNSLDLGTSGADKTLLAPADGTVLAVWSCAVSTNMRISHDDGRVFVYVHFDKNHVYVSNGTRVTQGQPLGILRLGTWEDLPCGYTSQNPSFAHVHWVLETYPSHTMDGWTIQYLNNCWQNGAETRCPGSYLYSTNGPDTVPPSALHELAGTVGQNGWYVSNVQVTIVAQDNNGGSGVKNIQYQVNGGGWQTANGASAQFTISNEGQTTVQYRSEDNAGNISGVQSVHISIDKTAPTSSASITTGTAGQNGWYTTNVQISQTGSDPAGGSGFQHLRYRIGTEAWQTVANTSTSFSVTSEGQTTVQYQAVDNAGNTNTKVLVVKIDKTNPTLSSAILNNNSPETSNINILVGATASDAHSGLWQIRFSNDNVNWGAWQGYSTKTAWSIPATNQQNHTLYTQVRDASGRTSTTASDAIVLNLYPARPASNRYSLCASSFSTSGQANMQSTSYRLTSSIGGNVGGASSGNSTTNAQSGFLAAVQACRALGTNAQWPIYLPFVRR